MPNPNVLYSASTLLAFRIAQMYYGDVHYAWCSPIFDGREQSELEPGVPPTSSPYEIYLAFKEEYERSELHSHRMLENRAGVVRGAAAKREAGTINKVQEDEIAAIAEAAGHRLFRPLIFVIPFSPVQELVRPVPALQKASLFSAEVIIPNLPRNCFDIIRP